MPYKNLISYDEELLRRAADLSGQDQMEAGGKELIRSLIGSSRFKSFNEKLLIALEESAMSVQIPVLVDGRKLHAVYTRLGSAGLTVEEVRAQIHASLQEGEVLCQPDYQLHTAVYYVILKFGLNPQGELLTIIVRHVTEEEERILWSTAIADDHLVFSVNTI